MHCNIQQYRDEIQNLELKVHSFPTNTVVSVQFGSIGGACSQYNQYWCYYYYHYNISLLLFCFCLASLRRAGSTDVLWTSRASPSQCSVSSRSSVDRSSSKSSTVWSVRLKAMTHGSMWSHITRTDGSSSRVTSGLVGVCVSAFTNYCLGLWLHCWKFRQYCCLWTIAAANHTGVYLCHYLFLFISYWPNKILDNISVIYLFSPPCVHSDAASGLKYFTDDSLF